MELLTLSSYKGVTDNREPHIDNCLPLGEDRPFMFEGKKTVFLTARVHPGETPASYVLNGILNYLGCK